MFWLGICFIPFYVRINDIKKEDKRIHKMNDYIARFRVNDFENQELKEDIRDVPKLAAAMGT